jgi:hypothetical protein
VVILETSAKLLYKAFTIPRDAPLIAKKGRKEAAFRSRILLFGRLLSLQAKALSAFYAFGVLAVIRLAHPASAGGTGATKIHIRHGSSFMDGSWEFGGYLVSMTKKKGDVGELTILIFVQQTLKRLSDAKYSSTAMPSRVPSS